MNRTADSNDTGRKSFKTLPKPQGLTSSWMRMTVALTVSVGIGLAPLLGTLGVPLFSPLLSLIPVQARTEAITLSTTSMSFVAIFVQWHHHGQISKKTLEKMFHRYIKTAVALFVGLILACNFLTVRVGYDNGNQTASFLKGVIRPNPDKCAGLSDEECISVVTFDSAKIAKYWGNNQITASRLIFDLLYVAFLSNIAFLVALIAIRDASIKGKIKASKGRAPKNVP